MTLIGSTQKDEGIEDLLREADSLVDNDFGRARILFRRAFDYLSVMRVRVNRELTIEEYVSDVHDGLEARDKIGFHYKCAEAYYAVGEYGNAETYLDSCIGKIIDKFNLTKETERPRLSEETRGLFSRVAALSIRAKTKQEIWIGAEEWCKTLLGMSRKPRVNKWFSKEFNEWILSELSDIYRLQGKDDQAMKLLGKYAKRMPSLYLNIAEIYAQRGKRAEHNGVFIAKLFDNLGLFLQKNQTMWQAVDENEFFKRFKELNQYEQLKQDFGYQQQPIDGSYYLSRWNKRGIFARLEGVVPSHVEKSS